jgi:hypothetical protein
MDLCVNWKEDTKNEFWSQILLYNSNHLKLSGGNVTMNLNHRKIQTGKWR